MSGFFEYYTETENMHLKYAKGKPSLTGREFHNYDEIVLFIDGDSRLVSKNIQQTLSRGSIVFVPKEHFHQFCINEKENYKRCILGFKETDKLRPLIREVMTEVKVISTPSKDMELVFDSLMTASKSSLPQEEKALLMEAAVVQLLISQKLHSHSTINKNISLSPTVRQALSHIDGHLADTLTVKSISDYLHISPSSLAHKFRQELNMSVYRYISEKRLSAVRQQIEKGETLATAALRCGFKDYSAFYRMYKKYYGKKPAELIKSK